MYLILVLFNIDGREIAVCLIVAHIPPSGFGRVVRGWVIAPLRVYGSYRGTARYLVPSDVV